MYYIQPWMLAVIIPLACVREGRPLFSSFFRLMIVFCNFCFTFFLSFLGQQLLTQIHLLNEKSFANIRLYVGIFGSSALLAFCLEFSEFLLVSNTSSLTLSVSGIFKVRNSNEQKNDILSLSLFFLIGIF